jgi:hypothetical protein
MPLPPATWPWLEEPVLPEAGLLPVVVGVVGGGAAGGGSAGGGAAGGGGLLFVVGLPIPVCCKAAVNALTLPVSL